MQPHEAAITGRAIPRVGRQRGAAVVTALLIVMLATTVVAGLFLRESVTVRSVENRLALSQARWIERAALDWAKVILRADGRASNVDHLGEPWAVPVADTRLDETVTAGAKISDASRSAFLAGQMFDAQSRLNLAALVQAGQPSLAHLGAFRRLLELLGLPESLADSALERVARGQPRLIDGRTEAAADSPVLRLTDLMTVPGFDAAVIAALAPFAVVLPRATLVNVNTAPPEVIAAVVAGVDLAGARRFVARRERTFFRDLADAAAAFDGQPTLPTNLLSVGSGYFIVRGVVRFDRVESSSETLLERTADRIDIVWQQRY
ncbi:MAG: type II secretion system minor pseudopilin GspK [Burkholderiaceae bacterium]|nr:type II secretion system minor pseudopilin GspK [Burkholderiaceae bacterium]